MNISIIAGQGDFPKILAKKSKNAFVICIDGISNLEDFSNPKITISLLNIEELFFQLKKRKINKVLFAGKFFRPNNNLNVSDKTSKKLLERIMYSGDDKSMEILRSFFTDEGFQIISPLNILNDNFFHENKIYYKNIDSKKIKFLKDSTNKGIDLLNRISQFDIGQSTVVLKDHVIGVEGLEGTNELIKRCGDLYNNQLKNFYNFGPVLVKIPKKNQSLDLDMPIIGLETVRLCFDLNFLGIAVSSKGTLVLNKEELIQFCLSNNFYLYSIGDKK